MTKEEVKQRAIAAIDKLHPGSMGFLEAMVEAIELHVEKSNDYGLNDDPLANVRSSEECGVDAWIGALVRANDKVIRLKNAAKGNGLRFESAEDSMLDLIVYWGIILHLYRSQHCEQAKEKPNAIKQIGTYEYVYTPSKWPMEYNG